MKQSLLDKFMSRKGLSTSFWIIALIMVSVLIYYTANLQKEVPPIPQEVVSASGEVLYTYDDVVEGKAFFQQFDDSRSIVAHQSNHHALGDGVSTLLELCQKQSRCTWVL